MTVKGHIEKAVFTALSLPICVGASVVIGCRFLHNPIRFCRTKARNLEDLPDPVEGMAHRYIEVAGGIKLHAATAGLGSGRPLLVMLHGFPETWYSWRHQIAAFKDDYEILALDMRGYGLSDAPKGAKNYFMDVLCADVAAAVRSVGHTSCMFAAHDWGGSVAWNMAANHPEMVERLAIVCSPHPSAYIDPKRFDAAQRKKSSYMLLFNTKKLPEVYLRNRDFEKLDDIFMGGRLGVCTPGAITATDMEHYKAAFARPGHVSGGLNYYRAAIMNRTTHQIPVVKKGWEAKLSMPVLLLYADNDGAFTTEFYAGTEEYAPQLTSVQLKNCSHWAQQDKPHEVNAHFRAFFSAASGKAAAAAKAGATTPRPLVAHVTASPRRPMNSPSAEAVAVSSAASPRPRPVTSSGTAIAGEAASPRPRPLTSSAAAAAGEAASPRPRPLTNTLAASPRLQQ